MMQELLEALKEARKYIAGGTPAYDFDRIMEKIDKVIDKAEK